MYIRYPQCLYSGQQTGQTVLNYFNYFTEIEERFQQRRGALLLLSTIDRALIETWREALQTIRSDSLYFC
jgi:hypothetical protein